MFEPTNRILNLNIVNNDNNTDDEINNNNNDNNGSNKNSTTNLLRCHFPTAIPKL